MMLQATGIRLSIVVSVPFTFEAGYENHAESTTVTASFQCNLYDDIGNVIHLTNGRCYY